MQRAENRGTKTNHSARAIETVPQAKRRRSQVAGRKRQRLKEETKTQAKRRKSKDAARKRHRRTERREMNAILVAREARDEGKKDLERVNREVERVNREVERVNREVERR